MTRISELSGVSFVEPISKGLWQNPPIEASGREALLTSVNSVRRSYIILVHKTLRFVIADALSLVDL